MPDDDDDDVSQSNARTAMRAGGKSLSGSAAKNLQSIAEGARMRSNERSPNSDAPRTDSYKRGGTVRKTGKALLHRGETVRPAKRKRGRGKRTRMVGRY